MERRKEVAVETPVTIAGITIIPVVMTSLHYQHIDGMVSVISFKRPTDVVLITPTSSKAFRITGEEVILDQLLQEVPELQKALRKAI